MNDQELSLVERLILAIEYRDEEVRRNGILAEYNSNRVYNVPIQLIWGMLGRRKYSSSVGKSTAQQAEEVVIDYIYDILTWSNTI